MPLWIKTEGVGHNRCVTAIKIECITSIEIIRDAKDEICGVNLYGVGLGESGFCLTKDRYNLTPLIELYQQLTSQ